MECESFLPPTLALNTTYTWTSCLNLGHLPIPKVRRSSVPYHLYLHGPLIVCYKPFVSKRIADMQSAQNVRLCCAHRVNMYCVLWYRIGGVASAQKRHTGVPVVHLCCVCELLGFCFWRSSVQTTTCNGLYDHWSSHLGFIRYLGAIEAIVHCNGKPIEQTRVSCMARRARTKGERVNTLFPKLASSRFFPKATNYGN